MLVHSHDSQLGYHLFFPLSLVGVAITDLFVPCFCSVQRLCSGKWLPWICCYFRLIVRCFFFSFTWSGLLGSLAVCYHPQCADLDCLRVGSFPWALFLLLQDVCLTSLRVVSKKIGCCKLGTSLPRLLLPSSFLGCVLGSRNNK